MATIILTKTKFLEWIERQIKDDQIVVISPDATKAEIKKKTNEKRIEYSFAADSFKIADSVNDLYTGRMLNCAMVFVDRVDISDETLLMIEE